MGAGEAVRRRAEPAVGPVPYLYWAGPDPQAPAAVLLHGLTSSSVTWLDLGAHLSDRFHVYAPDQRGHGLGPRPAEPEYPITRFADDLLEFLSVLGLRRPLLVGHSWGGGAALIAAAALSRDPAAEAPSALILEDPVHAIGTSRQRAIAARMLTLQGFDTEALSAELLRGEPTMTQDQLAERVAQLRSTSAELLEQIGADETEHSLLPHFSELACPVLLVLADTSLSQVFDDDTLAEAQPLLPAGSYATRLAQAPHTIHRSGPERFAREIDAFLSLAPSSPAKSVPET